MSNKKDNSKYIGFLIMGISLTIGAAYTYSLLKWISVHLGDPEAWTWWVIVVPIVIIVGFVLFFATWIGWVIVKPKPKNIDEFIKEQEAKIREKLSSRE
ncbi:MAG: hypothetical protein J7L38_08045 [Thermoproteales archaeon]|nr:hypothetical protein [Thermoproteales archaeon]RLE63108.1 MAG: hypothetical protein DRJ47_09815 [Thermoprotei archaeon]